MGASISHRPSKCLKSRRAKSEENLGPKRGGHFKNNMGRFFAPWHHFISDNMANCSSHENVNTTRYFTYSEWISSKDMVDNMEKSFNGIHHSNSLDKAQYETDYQKLAGDKFVANDSIQSNEQNEDGAENHGRLTIDVDKDTIFEVSLQKGSRGLGFSILEYDGFIFIKQLFPLEEASQTGMLQEGDIIVSANGTALTDLNTFEALQVLRTLENPVTLIVCRLQQFLNKKPITSSHVFPDFNTDYGQNSRLKEFEITMEKVSGSLGFTLRKDDEDEYSHVVRALVKEPALSDGRIKPGDQIVSVNDMEIDRMTHQEAVKFLRDCGDEVTLKLRRDTLSSSLTSLNSSHTETQNKTLRKEALEMLNDLAVKKSKVESEKDEVDISESRSGSISNYSEENISILKHNQTLFDGRENLTDIENSASHSLHDNMQISGDLGKLADEPVSLPALDVTSDRISFHHNDPAYHSMNVPKFNSKIALEDPFNQKKYTENKAGLLKWKGIVLDAEKEDPVNENGNSSNEEFVTVQLQRNWNSRLGFSLSAENGCTVISAIHADSVASKDGRLKINDIIIEVNGRNVREVDTNEIIDMLRTVRGNVTLSVHRNKLHPS